MRAAIGQPPGAPDRTAADCSGESAPKGSLAEKWADLHDQATGLARLAQLSPEPYAGTLAAFPAQIGDASKWQRELAWQGIEDIDAMMQPGLAALATLQRRGISASAPALALWREFYEARGAVLALARRESAEA